MIRTTPFPSKYIVNQVDAGDDKYWSTVTDYNQLLLAGGAHVKDYTDLSALAREVTYSKFGVTLSDMSSPFTNYLTGVGVQEVDKNFVRWRIYGDPDKRALSYSNPNSGDCVGVDGMTFELHLDVDYFQKLDVLSPHVNKRCQVVVQSDCIPFEGGYKYEVKLLDSDKTAFIDSEYLEAGEYWIKMGSLSSWEEAGSFGSLQFGHGFSYIEFEIPMTTMGWEFEVTGEAHRQFGSLEVMRADKNDKPLEGGTKITNFLEGKAMAQIAFEKQMFLLYGSMSNNLMDPVTSKPVTTSPGLMEFMEEGNIIPYSPNGNSIDFMMDQIDAFWYDRVPINQRKLMLFTGQGGMKLFSKWVREKFNNTAATFSTDFVLQRRQGFDQDSGRNGFAFSPPQFTEYQLDGFGTVMVSLLPVLDDTRLNGVKFPGTNYTVNSYEFIAFNIGLGEPNIRMLRRRDNEISTYIPGLWSPFGATGQNNPVFKTPGYTRESYKWIHKETFGLMVTDVTCLLHFKPNISY